MRSKNYKHISLEKGFVLFYAVIFSSIVLIIGLFMLNNTIKQVKLNQTVQDSQIAFYAADVGIECVLYWDLKHLNLAKNPPYTFPVTEDDGEANLLDINCFGQNLPHWNIARDSTSAQTELRFSFDNNKSCVIVDIFKTRNEDQSISTVVESNGYTYGCGLTSARRVGRGIRVTY